MFRKGSLNLIRNLSTVGLKPVATKNAPPAAASYSQAMKVDLTKNQLVFVSGQIPFTPDNKPIQGDIQAKAHQVFSNVQNILTESGSSLNDTVKVNVFLKDMNNFAKFNEVYASYFREHKPARSCVGVADLPLGVDLEMEVIAAVKND